ncbi:MAG: hypothetical protein HYS13_05940 [Planctomycetia bacterium]|nr:hypothetical protein [Planctomycetia bacterium]
MSAESKGYFATLIERFAAGWNRFWYTPADARPLAVMRIVTGVVALYLLASLTPDLVTFFSNDGILTPESVESWEGRFVERGHGLPPLNRFSFLNYLRNPTELWIGHLAALFVLGAYTVGLRTRITSVLALYVVLSYIHRAPMLTAQAEPALAMLMFYACLGPSGRHWSVDACLAQRGAKGAKPQPTWGANVALRLMQVHVALLYVAIAFSQIAGGISGPVWLNGESAWWIVARPETRLVDFTFIATAPQLIDVLTYGILLFELAFPLLMWNRLARPLLLGWAAVTWAFLALATGLVPYAVLMFAAGLAFVPGEDLRRWTSSLRRGTAHEPVKAA